MSIQSMRQLRLPEDNTRSPHKPTKSVIFSTPQKIVKVNTMLKTNSERQIKLPQIISPKQPLTLPEIKSSFHGNKASKFALNSKLDLLLGEIDATIKEETNRTRQISDLIDNRVLRINQHFNNKSRAKSTIELDKAMFTVIEKEKVINLYNQSLKSHYTNTASGIQYFKKNILHKEDQFGY